MMSIQPSESLIAVAAPMEKKSRGGGNRWRWGFSLVEVMVVAVLGALAMGGGIMIWTRTGHTVVKGEEMMDLQLALRSIQEKLRSDVRTMVSLQSCQKHQVAFTSRLKGQEVKITWAFEPAAKRLIRKTDGSGDTDFQAAGLVSQVEFSPLSLSASPPGSPSGGAAVAEGIRMALELKAGKEKGPVSRLAVVNQFSSRAIDPPFEIVR